MLLFYKNNRIALDDTGALPSLDIDRKAKYIDVVIFPCPSIRIRSEVDIPEIVEQ
ncbi:unnamed protein product, partial [Rotaria sp. Silwood1]